MKITLDDNEILTVSDEQKKAILSHQIWSQFEDELKKRICFAFQDLYRQSLSQLKAEWEPKLIDRGHEMLPVRLEGFANLVFSQPDYKNREQRDQEAAAARQALEQSTVKVM